MKSHRYPSATTLAAIAACLAALCVPPAHGASLRDFADDLNYGLGSVMDQIMPQGVNDLRLGAGAAIVPKYEGDNNTRVGGVPVIAARYKDLIFLDGSTLRVNLLNIHNKPGPHRFSAGPLVRLDFGRHESDSSDLRGLGNIGTSFEMGGFVHYSFGPGRLRATIRQDVTNGHKGLVATLDAGMILYRNNKIRVAAQTGITWVSARNMRHFFGVTPVQSAASGLPVYTPGSGIKSWGITAGGEYELFQQWNLGVKLDYSRLLGDAASSPLVRRRGSANQFSGGTFVYYSF